MNPRDAAPADQLNAVLGWRGADPEWARRDGYTGRVVLSEKAALRLAQLVRSQAKPTPRRKRETVA